MLFGFDTKKKKILTMLTLIMLVGTSFFTGAVLATIPSTWSDQPTYIGPGSMVSGYEYIVFTDTAGAYCAKNGVDGRINYRGLNFTDMLVSIQVLMGNNGGTILLASGTYVLNNHIAIESNISLVGSSKYSSIITSTAPWLLCLNNSHAELANVMITGSVELRVQADWTPVEDITIKDIEMRVGTLQQAAIWLHASKTTSSLRNVTLQNINIINPGTFGVLIQGNYDLGRIENVTMTDVKVVNAGRYARYNDWVTGFDLREGGKTYNLTMTRCTAIGSWESGFHIEQVLPAVRNIRLIDCYSGDNGQKANFSFGHGFMVAGGMTLTGCVAENNSNAGFEIVNNHGPESYLYNCVDYGSKIGFWETASVYYVELVNCVSYDAHQNGFKLGDSWNPYGFKLINCETYDSLESGLLFANVRNVTAQVKVVGNGYTPGIDALVILGFGTYRASNIDLDIELYSTSNVSKAFNMLCDNSTIKGYAQVNTTYGFRGDFTSNITIYDFTLDAGTNLNVAYSHMGGGTNILIEKSTFKTVRTSGAPVGYGFVSPLGSMIIGYDVTFIGGWVVGTNRYLGTLNLTNGGTILVQNGQTSVTLHHWCVGSVMSGGLSVTPLSDTAGRGWYITSSAADEFTINLETAAGASGVLFAWLYIPPGLR